MIYRPMYVDKIMAYVDTPFVKVPTGVRRCGKSSILKMIMGKLQAKRNIPAERIVSCRCIVGGKDCLQGCDLEQIQIL